jgi:hypothetical protein
MRTFIPSLLSVAIPLAVAGCGDGREKVYPVRGKVIDAKEKPAAGALVFFNAVGASHKIKPVGKVGDDGTFQLTSYDANDGAPAGEFVVTLIWPTPKKTPFDQEGPDQLKGRLADAGKSEIRFTVEKKPDNEVPVIRLP